MERSVKALVCALVLCFSLAACGESGENAGPGGQGVQQQGPADSEETGFSFVLKGVTIAVDAEMAPLAEQLGEPTDYFESDSCAFQGKDKVYTYGGVVISTYPQSGVDYVLSIDLRDDTVSTPEGISIGSTLEDVTAVYGETQEQTDTALIYRQGGCVLTFIVSDGVVIGITYTSTVLS